MKLCPKCKAELDDNARFCLSCMTALDHKEQIPPPVRQIRRWPLVLLCTVILSAILIFTVLSILPEDMPSQAQNPQDSEQTLTPPSIPDDLSVRTHTEDGVTYTFRSATKEDHPTAINVSNYYVLIRVEGTPSDGIYRVPSFVGEDINSLVTVIADGAFTGTDAHRIDLGYDVRYVWGNAFGGYPLSDLYLHTDVMIEETAFSGCTQEFTIHCPDYLENTSGELWCDLATSLGFRWQQEIM